MGRPCASIIVVFRFTEVTVPLSQRTNLSGSPEPFKSPWRVLPLATAGDYAHPTGLIVVLRRHLHNFLYSPSFFPATNIKVKYNVVHPAALDRRENA